MPGVAAGPVQATVRMVESVHFVDEGVDSGPIVLQERVPIEAGDTELTLAARILEREHRAYPEAITRVLAGLERRL